MKLEPIEYLVVECPPGPHRRRDGAGRQPPGRVPQDGQPRRADAPGVHHPGPRPDRPADADADRHQGKAIMHHNFHEYQPLPGHHPGRANGVMVSTETGTATGLRHREPAGARHAVRRAAASRSTRARSSAENCRDNDLPVNICREKKLTNMRAPRRREDDHPQAAAQDDAGAGPGVHRGRRAGRGHAEAIRLRKVLLKENDRKRSSGGKKSRARCACLTAQGLHPASTSPNPSLVRRGARLTVSSRPP